MKVFPTSCALCVTCDTLINKYHVPVADGTEESYNNAITQESV